MLAMSRNWFYVATILIVVAFYAGEFVEQYRCQHFSCDDTLATNAKEVIKKIRGGVKTFPDLNATHDAKLVNESQSSIISNTGLSNKTFLIPFLSSTTDESVHNETLTVSWEEKMIEYFLTTKCKVAPPGLQELTWLKQIFVLIGVQKGGTKAIHTFLEENPQFVSRCDKKVATREIFFFNRITEVNGEIDQLELQKQYASIIKNKCPLAVADLESNSSKMYLDDTPLYIQDSHEIPQLLNCVAPNSKVMAILRNPTDRAFSHYNFYLDRNWCIDRSFDEWVDINIKHLKESGIVNAKDPYEELLAWEKYNNNSLHRENRKCETFVTRGLYAIQLLHFKIALKAANRSEADLHVISSESLLGNQKQHEYDKILQFLGLAPHTLLHQGAVHKTAYERTMNETTRTRLNAFFRPYNLRLYELLKWDPIWEKQTF
jgi:hypothetical protein